MLLLSLAAFFFFFFKVNFKKKKEIFWEYYQSVKGVWIQSVLLCVQNVCKGFQQTTEVATSNERVKLVSLCDFIPCVKVT